MTAEIAIMNLQAIALAADSAVTVSTHGGQSKVFTLGNKLFALSRVAPVGILTYGNASFMGIPWETLVKEYRRGLADATFPRLASYMDNFCEFLVLHATQHISEETKQRYALALAYRVIVEIESKVDSALENELRKVMSDDESISMNKLHIVSAELRDKITGEIVDNYYSLARSTPSIDDSIEFRRAVKGILDASFTKMRKEIFPHRLPSGVSFKLKVIAGKAISGFMAQPSPFQTGIAIAGFGENDMLPALIQVDIEGFVCGQLKKKQPEFQQLTPEMNALIAPFAQVDMVHQFMEGIALEYQEFIAESLAGYLDDYLGNLVNVVENIGGIRLGGAIEELKKLHPQIVQSFSEDFANARRSVSVGPIVDAVGALPKEHLAEMAEALINLTSLKRRVSLEEETVGGPTDVALITKGDGMVWIKRKQYFPPELNQGYLARTYGRRGYGATIDQNEESAGAPGGGADA